MTLGATLSACGVPEAARSPSMALATTSRWTSGRPSSSLAAQAPAALLHPLKPTGPFRVVERKDGVFIDTRSYARYTPLAEAVDALDPPAVARLYAALKPRLEEAHREATP